MKDTVNDCFVDALGRVPTDTEISLISKNLPQDVLSLAEQWDWSDTEVGDKVYRWIIDNKELFE